jgi:hypothetical protein
VGSEVCPAYVFIKSLVWLPKISLLRVIARETGGMTKCPTANGWLMRKDVVKKSREHEIIEKDYFKASAAMPPRPVYHSDMNR